MTDKNNLKDHGPLPVARDRPLAASSAETTINALPPKTTGIRVDEPHSSMRQVLKDTKEIFWKGLPIALNPQSISAVLDAVNNTNSIDDRKMLLEHILTLLANTPPHTKLGKTLQDGIVSLFYNDLAHPTSTYVSNKFAWRTTDGSCNNVTIPDLGKAFAPYGRSVQQVHPMPAHMLPDAGFIFDNLLKREEFVKHPAGLSSLMFNFAALVVHTLFRTSHTDPSINETSSYVDLSPLYGVNEEQQNTVRVKNGRGLLRPDVFVEERLLFLPPAVSALLILFNRNHNFIARKILTINERGTWVNPASVPESDPRRKERLAKQDEEIFQTARLINCGWFAGVVFSDYLAAILGLVRKGSTWSLNPFEETRRNDHTFLERGRGNVVSVEFNCLYRWHAAISVEDEHWTQTVFKKFFGDKRPDEVSPMDFVRAARKAHEMLPDCEHWTFGNLQRSAEGSFSDADLARVLQDATSCPASAFKARGTPAVMRLNEIMGIEQSRKWGVCSLNDFRRFLGLKPYATFLEWNTDPEIAEVASRIYQGDIENLELYVGLQAEEPKPVVDGAGLCPGYTMSRAILADAIALTRGDRFFTSDMTPYNYTAWGLQDCQRDTTNLGCGSMLGRLLLRTLPKHYSWNSTYTWFPLMTPDAMMEYTKNLGNESRYDFERPIPTMPIHVIDNYTLLADILGDTEGFCPSYTDRFSATRKDEGFVFIEQTIENLTDHTDVLKTLFDQDGFLENVVNFFRTATIDVIERDSFSFADKQTKFVDISSALKSIPIRWVANEMAGIPLKSERNPDAELTDEEIFKMLSDTYECILLEQNPARASYVEDCAKKHMDRLGKIVRSNLRAISSGRFSFAGLFHTITNAFSDHAARKGSHEFMEKLLQTGKPIEELANSILSVFVILTVELSQTTTNMINLYLNESHAETRKNIQSTDPKNLKILQGYAREAFRIDPSFSGKARVDKLLGDIQIANGDCLFLDIHKGNLDPNQFPEPLTVYPLRPAKSYLVGDGILRSFGDDFVHSVAGSVLSAIFSLKNLRRAPGASGRLTRFRQGEAGMARYQYLDKNMNAVPWATSLLLQYDA